VFCMTLLVMRTVCIRTIHIFQLEYMIAKRLQ
jgi:hypothetical protein